MGIEIKGQNYNAFVRNTFPTWKFIYKKFPSGFGNVPSPQSKKRSHQNNQLLADDKKKEEKSWKVFSEKLFIKNISEDFVNVLRPESKNYKLQASSNHAAWKEKVKEFDDFTQVQRKQAIKLS